MRWKYIVNIVLSFVIFTIVATTLAVLLAGCSDNQPTRVAWLSVEKPPIKVIYIDRQGELDPLITSKVFEIVGHTKSINMSINNSTSVSATGTSNQSDVESDSDISSFTVQRPTQQ